MNSKDLKQLMQYISESNFVEFELEQENLKLKLVKQGAVQAAASPPQGVYPMPYLPLPPTTPTGSPVPIPPGSAEQPAAAAEQAGVYQVTSPMVGTFYRSPNPDANAYVEVGTLVQKGQVLCIIEAMKLMNEIESEVAGEILEIPASTGHPVEYGEVIFRIRMTS